MGWRTTLKAIQAAERRQQRDAKRRSNELERQSKEQAKRSAIEQARLEVETYESGMEVLLSVHRERGEVWDWFEIAASLPPHSPRKFYRHELKARQRGGTRTLDEACALDEGEFQEASRAHLEEMAEWERMKTIARRILAGEHTAYTEALVEYSGLAEISDLGSALHFTVHSTNFLECVLKVNGRQAIPSEVKTLTSTGKVSVKRMPKARFHEIYQDYVCSCVLRVAREVFALLPIETVLVTASADALDPRTGQTVEQPVLSAAISRAALGRLDFEHLDPSDAVESFPHRGDAKASRRSGEFERITPLTLTDLQDTSPETADLHELLATVREVRHEMRAAIERLNPQLTANPSPEPQPF